MIEIKNLTKSFGNNQVLKGINLSVEKGDVVVVIGPSGTGKSTFLRCINLLEQPTGGEISISDCCYQAEKHSKKTVHELRSKTAMVFQNYNLFKNMTALQNIMEPMITVQKIDSAKAREKAVEILNKVGLEDKEDSYPSRLSGGQQQRVGIGRAMAVAPEIILFDEPTSSLDPELVGGVLDVIRELAKQHITMMITTHEMDFAKSVADKVVFMADGYIVEEGTPEEIFEHPRNDRLQQFLKRYKK